MLLEVKDLNISLTSGKSVAEHISFRLGQGEMLSIVGSSGAGKTTICKAIMGLLGNAYRADGEILFQAENLAQPAGTKAAGYLWERNLPDYAEPNDRL